MIVVYVMCTVQYGILTPCSGNDRLDVAVFSGDDSDSDRGSAVCQSLPLLGATSMAVTVPTMLWQRLTRMHSCLSIALAPLDDVLVLPRLHRALLLCWHVLCIAVAVALLLDDSRWQSADAGLVGVAVAVVVLAQQSLVVGLLRRCVATCRSSPACVTAAVVAVAVASV
jgi:hypothetical protein